jgi:hypothetical protein
LLGLIKTLHGQKHWEASFPLMAEYCRRFPGESTRMRLLLAQLLIREVPRPGQALRVLAKLPDSPLEPSLEAARRKLVAQATRLQEDAPFELELQDW